MKPGERVRLRADPTRIGLLTDQEEVRGGRRRVLVRFFDGGEEYLPELGLELVLSETASPAKLIEQGRYGHVRDLRGALTFYRLSGKLADLIYSLNATNTDFYAYQFKPVLNFLDSPCRGLLIADEVGLGKTIEAGLIWTELRARVDARRLLVLCPAMLCEKWRTELSNRFGIPADICNAQDVLDRLERVKSHPHEGFALVASLQGLRPARRWDDEVAPPLSAAARLARHLSANELEDPLLDLVVIDEAHYLRNPDTQTAKLGQLLRPVTDNLVLLSATPIQLRSADLFHLLNLLDGDTFPYEHSFNDILEANAPIVHLRDRLLAGPMSKAELMEGLRSASLERIFSDNAQLSHLLENPPSDGMLGAPAGRSELAERLDRLNPLAKVVTRTRKRDVHEMRVVRNPVAYKATMTGVESAFYSEVTSRVREYCANFDISEGFMLTIPQRQMASSMAAACRSWFDRMTPEALEEMRYETIGDDDEVDRPRIGPLLEQLIQIVHEIGDFDALRRDDSKYGELLRRLREYWREYPEYKVVLFSFYRGTLAYLHERLLEDGVRSIVLQGGMDKQAAIREFAEPDGPSILLSSEVAAEGVDLQFSSLLVNYDLPWNPMKIEQRIGRIDRIGQKAERIVIWNLMYADTIDERVYDRLLERLGVFERALGSMEALLGDQIREMSYELLRHQLTAEQERQRIDQTSQAIANLDRQQEQLEKDAVQLIAHGEYIENKVKAARELGRYVSGQDLHQYVREFFDQTYPGCRFVQLTPTSPLEPEDLLFEIELSAQARVDLRQFIEEQRLSRQTLLVGYGGAGRPRFLFRNRIGGTPLRIEVISQDHPVVRFVSYTLGRLGKGHFFPVSAMDLAGVALPELLPGTYVYAVNRWSVTGARDTERLVFCASHLEDAASFLDPDVAEKLVTTSAMNARDWHGVANVLNQDQVVAAYNGCLDRLEHDYESFKGDIQRENTDRVSLMIKTLEYHRERQLARYGETLAKHRMNRRLNIIPAVEGKMQRVRQSIDERVLSLRQKQQISSSEGRVSAGVIRLA